MYVPVYESGNCVYLYSDNFIRVYDTTPTYNSNIHYTDYLINNHYLSREGYQSFGNYSTLPTCSQEVTTNYFQRTDIFEIIVIATIFIGLNWFLVSKLVKTLLKGGRII